MERLKTFFLQLNYRHYIAVAITLGFAALGVFVFPNAFGRIIESCRDFGLSVAYFFCNLFGIEHGITPTVIELPKIPFFAPTEPSEPSLPAVPVPSTWENFTVSWIKYWELWASVENLLMYIAFLGNILYHVCYALLFIIPLIVGFYVVLRLYFERQNNAYDVDSKPLKAYKWLVAHSFSPVRNWCVHFIAFIRSHKAYYITWAVMWLYYFNVFTIGIEFFAFYFYFVASFDVLGIYRQVYKLFIDLSVPITFIPPWVWVVIALFLADRFRKKVALSWLRAFELRNRKFISDRPIVFMECGTMGKKKTTAITDMALSQESMLRDKAFEKILECDLKFPYFPWINLENSLKRAIERHSVYNLATVRRFVSGKRRKFYRRLRKRRPLKYNSCFGYDYERYGFIYDDKLAVVDVWDVINTYAQLYFIYIIESSLLIANYSIRSDMILSDLGNFPLWDADFFERDSRLLDAYSRHAHILDFDTLRLGKRLVTDNPSANSFEFGVVVITEIGKERGNQKDVEGQKRTAAEANRKNDGFDKCLKMIRHSSTVDYYPFVKVITDEQRPESWGADARDLCEIVHIRDSGETKLAMPFFSLGELLYSAVFSKFTELYYKYRHVRSDNTLLMYLLKGFAAAVRRYYTRIYNRFGYCALDVDVERGTRDGEVQSLKYYLMNKKIYSRRFSTDCFSDYFAEKAMRSPVGLDELPEYAAERATFGELRQQNSYFINEISEVIR